MKKLVMIVLGLAILGLGLFYVYKGWKVQKGKKDNFASWQEFTPRSKLFKVALPQRPQYAKDFIAIPDSDKNRRYDMYASEKVDGTLFLIGVITYPPEITISSSEEILRQNIDELVHRKEDNRLTKLLPQLFEMRQAFDFRLENGELNIEGKAIHDGSTVYLLTYIASEDNFDPQEYQYFIQSFRFNGNQHKSK